MLEERSAQAREYLRYAEYYAERASTETNPAIQSDLIAMKEC
jgi:hypothetical protein